jgi:hypothetical protein
MDWPAALGLSLSDRACRAGMLPSLERDRPRVKGYATRRLHSFTLQCDRACAGRAAIPQLNTNAETFADVSVYKAMALLDTFPIGDPDTLIAFLMAEYPYAPFIGNDEINLVFARNIASYSTRCSRR